MTSHPTHQSGRATRTGGWNLPLAVILAGAALSPPAAFVYEGMRLSPQFALPLVMTIPGIVFSALAAWKGKRWMYLAAGLTAPLFAILALVVFKAYAGLASGYAFEFTAAVLAIGSLALALPAGIVGFRRGDPRPLASYATVVAALIVGASAAGLAFRSSELAAPAASYDIIPEERVTTSLKHFSYQERLRIRSGVLTEVVVVNEDGPLHTFTYEKDGRTYSHAVPGGASARFLVFFEQPGTFRVWCEPHPGMEATFEVV